MLKSALAFRARTREIKVLSDLSPVGLFRVNANGTFIYANQRWVDITGVPAAEEASFESMCVVPQSQRRIS